MTDIVERLRFKAGTHVPVVDTMMEAADEIERLTRRLYEVDAQLTAEDHIHARENMALRAEKDDEIARLRAAIEWLMKQPWKSIDKDNMEYQAIVSCYVRDALLAALEPKP